jgi:hypothetical protein
VFEQDSEPLGNKRYIRVGVDQPLQTMSIHAYRRGDNRFPSRIEINPTLYCSFSKTPVTRMACFGTERANNLINIAGSRA